MLRDEPSPDKSGSYWQFPNVSAGVNTAREIREGGQPAHKTSLLTGKPVENPVGVFRQARFAYAREIGQKTMNQCRFSNGKARIIRMKKIKASDIYGPSPSVFGFC